MALLATQSVALTGLAPAYAAAAGGGDTFAPDKDTLLHVKNASGAPISVTIITPRTDPVGNAVADVVVSVPATTGDRMIGPFPAEIFADPTTGVANITYSGVTSLTVAIVKNGVS